MKKYLSYLLLSLTVIFLSCDNPAPTELVDSNSSSDIQELEIIGKDLDNEYYTSGFDTTGHTDEQLQYTSIISVSGIKLSKNGRTDRISAAQTIIFDRTRPYYSPTNRLLGFSTITPGIIKFNNLPARFVNYRIRFRYNGNLIDTVLGNKYELFNVENRPIYDSFVYPYNSQINFSYNPFIGGNNKNFTIYTPKEVTGSLQVINNGDLKIKINWNPDFVNKFFIIVGGGRQIDQTVFPIYRIKTQDDGNFILPGNLIRNIPKNKFNQLSISLIRKYDNVSTLDQGDLYVSSQSIHTIIVELP